MVPFELELLDLECFIMIDGLYKTWNFGWIEALIDIHRILSVRSSRDKLVDRCEEAVQTIGVIRIRIPSSPEDVCYVHRVSVGQDFDLDFQDMRSKLLPYVKSFHIMEAVKNCAPVNSVTIAAQLEVIAEIASRKVADGDELAIVDVDVCGSIVDMLCRGISIRQIIATA
jgi:hypothetical protein